MPDPQWTGHARPGGGGKPRITQVERSRVIALVATPPPGLPDAPSWPSLRSHLRYADDARPTADGFVVPLTFDEEPSWYRTV